MIERILEERIQNDFQRGKVVVLLGSRQVGKTTTELKALISGYDMVFIDEAQRVGNEII